MKMFKKGQNKGDAISGMPLLKMTQLKLFKEI
jgi:hypothetical protein